MTVIVAPICGPILGGYISDTPLGMDLLYQRAHWRGGGADDPADPAQPGNQNRTAGVSTASPGAADHRYR